MELENKLDRSAVYLKESLLVIVAENMRSVLRKYIACLRVLFIPHTYFLLTHARNLTAQIDLFVQSASLTTDTDSILSSCLAFSQVLNPKPLTKVASTQKHCQVL